jgi:hypothetical protein
MLVLYFVGTKSLSLFVACTALVQLFFGIYNNMPMYLRRSWVVAVGTVAVSCTVIACRLSYAACTSSTFALTRSSFPDNPVSAVVVIQLGLTHDGRAIWLASMVYC